MNTVSLNVMAVRPRRVWRWAQAKQGLTKWRINARSRNELMSLSDRCLQDIGDPAARQNLKLQNRFGWPDLTNLAVVLQDRCGYQRIFIAP